MQLNTYPTIEQWLTWSAEYPAAPLWRVYPQGDLLPAQIFLAIKRVSRHCFILDSAGAAEHGRYTFLGYAPTLGITAKNGVVTIRGAATQTIQTETPNEVLRGILRGCHAPAVPELPPFIGGLVGWFGYDSVAYTEPVLRSLAAEEEVEFCDIDLMLFDKIIAFDNLEHVVYLIYTAKCDTPEESYAAASWELDSMERLVGVLEAAKTPRANAGGMHRKGGLAETTLPPLELQTGFTPLFDEAHWNAMVETAKWHIREGDIFQVVLSNRLEARASGSLFEVYQTLRETNPSPYMFYFSSDSMEVAGAAPETLVKCTGHKLFTYPLAGTRPRGKTEAEDLELERSLLADEKELSEHNMLVDLGRNDIGRISEFGSVRVEDYMRILRFSTVMHIGSTVTGTLREGLDALDAIAAILPAGTLSGAPKIRACQIISNLEQCGRGIYGGGIGYLGFDGGMDTCIAIRIAYKHKGKLYVRAGAGIVADSVPEREYQECQNKMKAVLLAIDAVAKHKAVKT